MLLVFAVCAAFYFNRRKLEGTNPNEVKEGPKSIYSVSSLDYAVIGLGILSTMATLQTTKGYMSTENKVFFGMSLIICVILNALVGLGIVFWFQYALTPNKYQRKLSSKVDGFALSANPALWTGNCFLVLLETCAVTLFPWKETVLCKQLEGYPTVILYKMVSFTGVIKSVWISVTLILATTVSFPSLTAFLTNFAILIIILRTKLFNDKLVLSPNFIIPENDYYDMFKTKGDDSIDVIDIESAVDPGYWNISFSGDENDGSNFSLIKNESSAIKSVPKFTKELGSWDRKPRFNDSSEEFTYEETFEEQQEDIQGDLRTSLAVTISETKTSTIRINTSDGEVVDSKTESNKRRGPIALNPSIRQAVPIFSPVGGVNKVNVLTTAQKSALTRSTRLSANDDVIVDDQESVML